LQKESLNSDSQQCNIFSPQIIEHKKEQDILRCGGVKPVNGIPILPLFTLIVQVLLPVKTLAEIYINIPWQNLM